MLLILTSQNLLASIGSALASPPPATSNDRAVVLTAMLTDLADPQRWPYLLEASLEELRKRHPEINIDLNYTIFPYNVTRTTLLQALSENRTVDIVSLDQIWLGEFAERGLLTDLTERVENWSRFSDWYEANIDGSTYKGKIYGIWAWTDIRGLWYWKDMLSQANVDPNSLKTWDGYLDSAKKINATLNRDLAPALIQPLHLNGDVNSPDMWYPYLWMLGGSIVERKSGHPTKDVYWFPAFNSTQGIEALQFLKDQVDVGLKPQSTLDKQFVDRNFAVMLSGSWMPSVFNNISGFEQRVGFLPAYPVPEETIPVTTMMGGWQLSIPPTSKHKDLTWELITIMLEPKIIAPWLEQYGYLPTQISIGESIALANPPSSFPYYEEMVSMIPFGQGRPNIPEYPQIAVHIKEALDNVHAGLKAPKQALDDAAKESANVLGW
jgi:multiple sugar transport system substrate-binding protein